MDSVPLGEGIPYILLSSNIASTWIERALDVSMWAWISILLCVVLSAVFSASETALTALNYAKIHQLVNKDPDSYRRFRLWRDRPNRVLTTILIGNNLVNISATSIATTIAQAIFLHQGAAVAVGVMTLVILVSGEIVPKTYAKHHAEQVARWLLPFLQLCYWLFLPATLVLVRLASRTVTLFGGKLSSNGPFITEEEIEYLIDLGSREGVLCEQKEKLLQSILEFDDIKIREIMVPRINMVTLAKESTPEEVLVMAANAAHSRIPVYGEDQDDIVGILYLRDFFRTHTSSDEEEAATPWTELLRPVYFVPGTMKISMLLREFQKRKMHLAVVVDEFGGTMGLVSLEDILEEIVGEIHDEYDPEEAQEIVKIDEGLYHVDATISLRDLEELLEVEFPEDGDFETLGGFLTDFAGEVPQKNTLLEWRGFSFMVLEANEKHIEQIEIMIPTNIEDTDEEDEVLTPREVA